MRSQSLTQSHFYPDYSQIHIFSADLFPELQTPRSICELHTYLHIHIMIKADNLGDTDKLY